jgi:hypothetical protein
MSIRRAIRIVALLLNAYAVLYWFAMLAWAADSMDSWRRFLNVGDLLFLLAVMIAPVFALTALLWRSQQSH